MNCTVTMVLRLVYLFKCDRCDLTDLHCPFYGSISGELTWLILFVTFANHRGQGVYDLTGHFATNIVRVATQDALVATRRLYVILNRCPIGVHHRDNDKRQAQLLHNCTRIYVSIPPVNWSSLLSNAVFCTNYFIDTRRHVDIFLLIGGIISKTKSIDSTLDDVFQLKMAPTKVPIVPWTTNSLFYT